MVNIERRKLMALTSQLGMSAMIPSAFMRSAWASETANSSTATKANELAPETPNFASVTQGVALNFPRDHGAHPDFRTEWWYLTGIVESTKKTGDRFGFQCTFFRTSTGLKRSSKRFSAFTPEQLVMAHFAVTTLSANLPSKPLTHVQRIARAGFNLAGASEETTDVHIRDWRLRLKPNVGYEISCNDPTLAIQLLATLTQPKLLQGSAGFSRKGPLPAASYYYSQPQLAVAGTIALENQSHSVTGKAWLDHEWSTKVMSGNATGWDWVGINFDDGSAFMAFRMRDKTRNAIWSAATLRNAAGKTQTFTPEQITITPSGEWQSPRSQSIYPASLSIRLNATGLTREFIVTPLAKDQEVDARATTGTIYWEGAVALTEGNKRVGVGYLEMTGYWSAIQF